MVPNRITAEMDLPYRPEILTHLDRPRAQRQADMLGLDVPAVGHLVAIDRVLRSLVKAGALDADAGSGWVVAGATALLGCYLRGREVLRVPEELCLAPLAGAQAIEAETMAEVIAAALPMGSVTGIESGVTMIAYEGALGPATLPVRFERSGLRMATPAAAAAAQVARPGYLFDPRMAYRGRVAKTFVPVPIAYAEEIWMRAVVALLTPGRVGDGPARTDDLRVSLLAEAADVRAAFAGPIRDAMIAAAMARGGQPDAAELRRRLEAVAANIRRIAARFDHPDALPAWLRPAGSYGVNDQRTFEAELERATVSLVRGS